MAQSNFGDVFPVETMVIFHRNNPTPGIQIFWEPMGDEATRNPRWCGQLYNQLLLVLGAIKTNYNQLGIHNFSGIKTTKMWAAQVVNLAFLWGWCHVDHENVVTLGMVTMIEPIQSMEYKGIIMGL